MNTLYLVLAIVAVLLAAGATFYAASIKPSTRTSIATTLLGFAVLCLAVVEIVRAAKAL